MTRLPASLAPWSEPLAVLDPVLARALGPLVHGLDELLGRFDVEHRVDGEPDGYDGTTNRGHPDRLLAEEWLLAEEVPLEFLRRSAEGELRHLYLARRAAAVGRRVVVLVDSGPEQLGPGRLVQLAAFVVLARRTRAAAAELVVVDAQSGEQRGGDLEPLLRWWLALRTASSPDPAVVKGVLDDVGIDQAWVVGGPTLTEAAGSHRRTVTTRIESWTDDRAEAVEVRAGAAVARLPLPPAPVAVAALRGEGLIARRRGGGSRRHDGATTDLPLVGRGVAFTSEAPYLVWRGASDDELYQARVGGSSGRSGAIGPVRRHRVPGAVLAASVLGRRTVVLVSDGESARVHVIGKSLASVHEIHEPLTTLGLATVLGGPVRPLLLWGGNLLVPLPTDGAETWWRLTPTHAAAMSTVVAAGPGRALDHPRVVYRGENGGRNPTLLHDRWRAERIDETRWGVSLGGSQHGTALEADHGHAVLALSDANGVPTLVTRSRGGAGRLVVLRSAAARRVLTAWAGPADYSAHPTLPWLSRATEEGIRICRLADGSELGRLSFDREGGR